MARVLADLYQFLTLFLPWKAVVAGGVVLGLLAAPRWFESVREKQLRGQVRRMVRAEQPDRDRLLQDTFALAGDDPERLRRLFEAATQYDQRDVARHALDRLQAVAPRAAAELRARVEPVRPKARLPLEIVVRAESLHASGMTDRAREVVEEGLKDHPADPDLLALRDRLA